MAVRTFEVIRLGAGRWAQVPPGTVLPGDVVRVKDDGVVVDALDPAVAGDPQYYFVFSSGTTSVVRDPVGPGSVLIGVTVLHPNGGLGVIPLTAP